VSSFVNECDTNSYCIGSIDDFLITYYNTKGQRGVDGMMVGLLLVVRGIISCHETIDNATTGINGN